MSISRLPKNAAIFLVAAAMDRRLGTLHQDQFRWLKNPGDLEAQGLSSTEYTKGAQAASMLLAANHYAVHTWAGKNIPLEVVHEAEMKAGLDLAAKQRAAHGGFEPLQVLRTAAHFEANCEVNLPSWQQSEALSFLTQLKACATQSIPGFLETSFVVPSEWELLPDLTRGNTTVPDAPNPIASYVLHPEQPPAPGESHIL